MIGRTIASRYQIEQSAGAEGPASLHVGRDVLDGTPVLFWTVDSSPTGTPGAARLLLDGARAASGLADERIPKVLEADESSGLAFVVVERTDGSGLDQVVKGRGKLSAADAIGLAYQALSALGAAHGAGLVHGRIEPRKLVLREDGLLKVTGIESAGLAPHLPAASSYAAPEVLEGKQPDARSDFFSLGVVLYELLSGRLPYPEGEETKAGPTPLRLLRPDAPRELEALLDRVLALDPDQRPQSAEDMSKALEAAMQGKPYEFAGPIARMPQTPPEPPESEEAGKETNGGDGGTRPAAALWQTARVRAVVVAVVVVVAAGAAIAGMSGAGALPWAAGASAVQIEPTVAPAPAPTAAPAPTTVPTAAPTAVPTRIPTLAPTTAPTAVPTTGPTATPIPNPMLASISARVRAIRVFESGQEGLPIDQRQYATRFPAATTRYVNYELYLTYPDPKRLIEFGLRALYYDSTGAQIASQLQNARIESGWTQSYHWNGYGWNVPGNWKPGQYRLDLYDATEKITTMTFEVY